MKIAFLTPSLHGGGAERVVRRWARMLRDGGHDITLLTYIQGAYAKYEPADLGLEGTTRRHFDGGGGRARWRAFPIWVRRETLQAETDVLVSVLTFSNLAALMAFPSSSRRPAVVISERNPLTPLLRSEGLSGQAKLRMAKALYRRADGAVAISHPVAADLASLYAVESSRLFVVPNPVFRDLAPPGRTLTARQGRIVFVGRHVPQKNPHLVLDTAAALKQRGASVTCVMYGDGPLRTELEQRASALGLDCEFPGWQEDWQSGLGPSDCFLLPSHVEGFGNVLVEASAHGIPVVAPAQALGIADAIVPAASGIIALSSRPEHLADAVAEAWGLAPDRAGLDAWRQWFSLANSAGRLEEVLRTVLEERGHQVF